MAAAQYKEKKNEKKKRNEQNEWGGDGQRNDIKLKRNSKWCCRVVFPETHNTAILILEFAQDRIAQANAHEPKLYLNVQ